ncbi:MAG: tRNA-guanine transglycosylase, partial [Terriglobales bacterium]
MSALSARCDTVAACEGAEPVLTGVEGCPDRPAEQSSAALSRFCGIPGARCAPARTRASGPTRVEATQALFGIVQGGMDAALRKESAERTIEIGFPGYAIGGLSVGEPRVLTREIVETTLEHLPHDQPRYLMGVG